jgi:hypothetical protein
MILYLLYLQLFFFYGIILGLTGPTTCVRIVHDLTQPQREAKNLGDIFFFLIVALNQYLLKNVSQGCNQIRRSESKKIV